MSQTRSATRRTRAALAAAGAAALFLAACGNDAEGGSSDDADDKIRIGISLPLTGDFSEPGEGVQRGYEIWRDMVNEEGGLLGRQVELIIMDDQS
ncbi:MAG TPA: ABC transporter substrate-binding protein, partial [Jiangellaceae bacterium]|nr:ABC transporter substrate-binding protein [Jiangellaceae bacterium]